MLQMSGFCAGFACAGPVLLLSYLYFDRSIATESGQSKRRVYEKNRENAVTCKQR